ncbi:hypothetical protein Mapa_003733 [Marchantia paleacea]|nr:hypothetical protein Mapa_003733 [Marchantia paleacea]
MARVPGAPAMRENPLHTSVVGSSLNAKLVASNSSSCASYGRNGFLDCNLSAASVECEFFCRMSPAGELCSSSSHVSILNQTGRRGGRASGKAVAAAVEETGKRKSGGRFYFNVTGFPFPLGPFFSRRTTRTEVQRGSIWLFEQEQALGFSSVTTNTRMTVIKLKSGGLWVHAPIGPTDECIQLLKELELPIEYIVLPTFAYEHKIFVGPFSRAFPRAQVWVAPRQWSWPLNLPLPFLGIFGAKVLKDDDLVTPWADEIEHKILSCPEVGIGPYVEVAFYHKASRSLLVTDAVIYVPDKPPSVVSKEALLDAAKNGLAVKVLSAGKEVPDDPIVDNAENRQRGWERMVLQILFLGPSNLLEPTQSFRQMSKKLIVSPIVKTLVYNKVPEKVKIWVDSIARDWKFKQIIPCHFSGPVAADARVFKAAFAFLSDLVDEKSESSESPLSSLVGFFGRAAAAVTYPTADMKTLSSLDNFLVSTGAVKKTVSGKKKK